MSRKPQPRYYPSRKGWFVQIHGKKIPLARGPKADTKKEAEAAYHRLMASGVVPGQEKPKVNVATLSDLFLDECQRKKAPLTYEWYLRHLQSFVDEWGRARAADIRPLHVTRWTDKHKAWSDSTKHGAITAVKTMFSWAKKVGHLDENPVLAVERPGIARRGTIMDAEQTRKVLGAIRDDAFRDLLLFLWMTGARPSEAARLEASMVDFDAGMIAMPTKTTKKTRKLRKFYLTPILLEFLAPRVAARPEGPVFLNLKGRPWTRNAMACRFARLREKLGMGKEATAESFRHRYATDLVLGGESQAIVAEMLGHQNTKMVDQFYSHIHEEHAHLRRAADAVRPLMPGDDPES